MKDYNEIGCINILDAAYKRTLKTADKEQSRELNMHFVKENKVFDLWCYITGQDRDRLANLAILKNHKSLIS